MKNRRPELKYVNRQFDHCVVSRTHEDKFKVMENLKTADIILFKFPIKCCFQIQ